MFIAAGQLGVTCLRGRGRGQILYASAIFATACSLGCHAAAKVQTGDVAGESRKQQRPQGGKHSNWCISNESLHSACSSSKSS